MSPFEQQDMQLTLHQLVMQQRAQQQEQVQAKREAAAAAIREQLARHDAGEAVPLWDALQQGVMVQHPPSTQAPHEMDSLTRWRREHGEQGVQAGAGPAEMQSLQLLSMGDSPDGSGTMGPAGPAAALQTFVHEVTQGAESGVLDSEQVSWYMTQVMDCLECGRCS